MHYYDVYLKVNAINCPNVLEHTKLDKLYVSKEITIM